MLYNPKTVLLIFTYRTIFYLFTFLVEKFRDRMRLKTALFDKSTFCGTIPAHALRGFQKQCVQSVSGIAPPQLSYYLIFILLYLLLVNN